ncbi:hypothetical protein Hypma_005015 [Hypsizygus marmoreus]|uniref:F-box domain-containing protein n=1 Tax=Hypsizygus marmoreus TaxID=39966 RepID=A0A369K2U4_HYPMA|nr:hypothetical protein Hypma_005015 [Hypsizygus marmoreus]
MLIQSDERNYRLTTAFPLATFMRLPLIPWSSVGGYLFGYQGPTVAQQDSTTTLQSRAAPINDIPVELLGELFAACLRDADPLWYYGRERPPVSNSPSNFFDPMTLGQVCRHWRAVALSMPTLWTSMRINSPRRGHLPLTQTWLERSGVCPLRLFLFQDSGSEVESAVTDVLVALLNTQAHRWRSIDFRFFGKPPSALFKLSHGSLSQLVSATLLTFRTSKTFSETSTLDTVWQIIHSTPTLRRVHWDSDYLISMPSHIPWRQLTDIRLNARLSTTVIFDLLHHCPNTVSLEVHIEETASVPFNPVILPCLRHLCIRAECPLDPIFDQLTLPQISSLRLDRFHEPITSEELSSLNHLLVSSNRYLQRLFFNDGQRESTRSNIVAMLRLPRLSCLKDLYIVSRVGDQVVQALTCQPQHSRDHLLPVLEYLTIGDCRGTTPGLLGNMASSRAIAYDQLVKLRTLEIFCWDINMVDKEVLKKLSKDGLHISVEYDE